MSSLQINQQKERLYEAMEDHDNAEHDNAELNDYDRDEQLMDQVQTYNENHGTSYDKRKELQSYKRWRWSKYSQFADR